MNKQEYTDHRSQKLVDAILNKYPSIRAFSKEVGIPNGTIISALNNGIDGMAYSKVIRICDCLQVDYVTFEPVFHVDDGKLDKQTKRLLSYYEQLSESKKEKVVEYIKDIS